MHDSFSIKSYPCPYNLQNNCTGQNCPKWINFLDKPPQTEEEYFLWCTCFEKNEYEKGIFVGGSCKHFDKIFDSDGTHKNPSEIIIRIPDIYWCSNCKCRIGHCNGQ